MEKGRDGGFVSVQAHAPRSESFELKKSQPWGGGAEGYRREGQRHALRASWAESALKSVVRQCIRASAGRNRR